MNTRLVVEPSAFLLGAIVVTSYSHMHHASNKNKILTRTSMMGGIAGKNRMHLTSCIYQRDAPTRNWSSVKHTLTTIQLASHPAFPTVFKHHHWSSDSTTGWVGGLAFAQDCISNIKHPTSHSRDLVSKSRGRTSSKRWSRGFRRR